MDYFRTLPPQRASANLNLLLLRNRWQRRDPPTKWGERVLRLQYHCSYANLGTAQDNASPAHDSQLAIDALYEHHQQRQAMLGALAQLRGDDGDDKVW